MDQEKNKKEKEDPDLHTGCKGKDFRGLKGAESGGNAESRSPGVFN
jgi:hypothetical protein